MSSPTNRLNIRKRKKVYSNESNLSRQQQQQEFLPLELTNTSLEQKPTQPLEDDKLINYINKMHPRVDVSQPDKVTYITILLTLSEPQRILEQKQKLIDNFKIGDILVTNPVPGSIDQSPHNLREANMYHQMFNVCHLLFKRDNAYKL